jgi:polysaccharide export outer membrane protein
MSQTYLYLNSHVVNEEGYLTFTFIDKMYVQGLTIEEIQKQLQATMSTYFKDVTITVKMVSFEVSVIGEVASAGKFLIPEDNTNVLEVVALAGGFKEYADRQI